MKLFATTPKGLELLLVEELRALGAESVAEKLAGVEFYGDMTVAYKACLWSRLANRILMPLAQVPAATPEELYAGVQSIQWQDHMDPESSLHVNFVSSQSEITHTLFGAQKVKDAIVDQFRQQFNTRPTVSREQPDLSIHVYLHRNIASISIDLSGESLHKRGIRVEQVTAPLKENLAAAILLRSGWKSIANAGGMLIDPMCGSGTFLIEAAQMAANVAPGLSREYFGFLGWKKHDAEIWKTLQAEAREQQIEELPTIVGYDANPDAIRIAFANIERAGLLGKIHVEKKNIADCLPKANSEPGLVIMNPPYGERLGEEAELKKLYELIGTTLKNHFQDWRAAVFTGNPDLGKNMGLRARKHYALFNGAIPCQLLLFDVTKEWFIDRSPEAVNEKRIRKSQRDLDENDLRAAQMFVNRLQKNLKHIRRWAERENIHCYRIYDADLPEYAVSVDRYEDKVVVKEYHAPKSVDKTKAERRLQQVLAVLPDALQISAKQIYLLNNHRSEIATASDFQIVHEGQVKFLVDLRQESEETGLPLNHRLFRQYVFSLAKDKHCLNLFSRSGTATVMAALAGAKSTVSVDDSEIYLDWTEQNLLANDIVLTRHHQLVEAEPSDWVLNHKNRYDLILVDLPESSHRLREECHEFIADAMKLLRPDGVMLLTSRDQRFKLNINDAEVKIEEMTQRLLPDDFARQPRACLCWKIHC